MGLLIDDELNMYRTKILCAHDKLTKGMIDNPVSSDQAYRIAYITGFPGGLLVTDSLVHAAVVKEYVKQGIGREIMEWCKKIVTR